MKNKQIWDRSGFDHIISRLLDLGCFTTNGMTPLQSVYNADAMEALRILSIKNSLT